MTEEDSGVAGRLWRRTRKIRGPQGALFVDQVVSSGSNAAAVILASTLLEAGLFNQYSLIQILATSLIGMQRALVAEPSLALSNNEQRADPSKIWAAAGLLPLAILAGTVVVASNGVGMALVAAASLVFPALQDLLRYRALGLGAMRRVLAADSCWLVLYVVAIVVIPSGSLPFVILAWTVPALMSCSILLLQGDDRVGVPIAQVLNLGRYQLADWGLGTLTAYTGMFAAQFVAPFSTVGAFRLAQTLAGPLTTISSFVTVRSLVDAPALMAMDREEAADYARGLGRRLRIIALTYGALIIAVVYFSASLLGPSFEGILEYPLQLTLIAAVVTAPAAVYSAYIKATLMQKFTVRPRFEILSANLLLVVVGLFASRAWGLDPLVLPTTITALATAASWRLAFNRSNGVRSTLSEQKVS